MYVCNYCYVHVCMCMYASKMARTHRESMELRAVYHFYQLVNYSGEEELALALRDFHPLLVARQRPYY